MSIMGMRRRFARHLKTILWIILAVFVIGIPFIYFGGRGLYPTQIPGAPKPEEEVVATVAGEEIFRSQLDASYRSALEQQTGFSPSPWGPRGVSLAGVLGLRYQALMGLASSLAMAQEARQRGFTATKSEVRSRLEQEVEALIRDLQELARSRSRDPREFYREFMARQGNLRSRVSEGEFRGWLRDLLSRTQQEQIERLILAEKLRASIIAPIRISDADLLANYDEAKVRAILISTSGAKSRSEEEAKKQAAEVHARLKKGERFEALAKAASDEPDGKAATEWTPRSTFRAIYGEEAEKAAFSLAPGKFSAPVQTPSGYAIFKLEAIRRQLPADFAKKKEEEKKRLLGQRQGEAWGRFAAEVLEKLEIQPRVPEIAGLKALAEGKQAAAMAEFEKALEDPQGLGGEVFSSMCYHLGHFYFGQKEWEKAREKLEASLSPVGDFPHGAIIGYPEEIYLALGKIALEEKNPEEALDYFAQADASATGNYLLHLNLLEIYQKLGKEKKAKEQEKWLEEYRQEQARALREAAEAQKVEKEQKKPSQQKAAPSSPLNPQKSEGR